MLLAPSHASHPQEAVRAALLGVGVAAAVALRLSMGGVDPAASLPAAVVFAGVLAGLAVAAGAGRPTIPLRRVAAGAAAGVALFAVWALSTGAAAHLELRPPEPPVWSLVVVAVAVAEEAVLRGALFTALERCSGTAAALAATSVAFALLHVPLYGWPALPVDLMVGLLLGGLRVAGGGVAAPAAAHAVADLLGGWLW